ATPPPPTTAEQWILTVQRSNPEAARILGDMRQGKTVSEGDWQTFANFVNALPLSQRQSFQVAFQAVLTTQTAKQADLARILKDARAQKTLSDDDWKKLQAYVAGLPPDQQPAYLKLRTSQEGLQQARNLKKPEGDGKEPGTVPPPAGGVGGKADR